MLDPDPVNDNIGGNYISCGYPAKADLAFSLADYKDANPDTCGDNVRRTV
jgi:hypothetical protein